MSDEIYAKDLLRWAAETSHVGHLPEPTIHGHYTLTANGMAYSMANVLTGVGIGGANVDNSLQTVAGTTCNFTGAPGAGCGSANYDLDLNFLAGSTFTNGDPLSIYGAISLSTAVHAGGYDLTGLAGSASAFIDPTITLNPLLNQALYTLNVGNGITLPTPSSGTVPEPASWAMMLVGFGLTGALARRKQILALA